MQKIICLFINFLSSSLNQFLQSEIIMKISSSFQNITHITVVFEKKIKCSLYICGVIFHFNLWSKLNSFLRLLVFCFSEPKLAKTVLILIKQNLRCTLSFSVTIYFEKILCSIARRFISEVILYRYLQTLFYVIAIAVTVTCCSNFLIKAQNFRKNRNIKGALSGLRQFSATENPLK